jgi:hypothetical protein
LPAYDKTKKGIGPSRFLRPRKILSPIPYTPTNSAFKSLKKTSGHTIEINEMKIPLENTPHPSLKIDAKERLGRVIENKAPLFFINTYKRRKTLLRK